MIHEAAHPDVNLIWGATFDDTLNDEMKVTFNEQYEMISFTTNDRAVTNGDGTMEYIPWSAVCGEYQFSETGMKYPTKFQAVWHYPDGDFIYFDGKISSVIYGNI